MRALATIAGAAMLVGSVHAQTVWSMGSPWTDLSAVVAAAAPGDVVLLNGLTFPPFVLKKGLTIVGPGTIRPATTQPTHQETTVAIPPGETAHLAHVDFLPLPVFDNITHRVVASGTVAFEDCSFGAGVPQCLSVSGTALLDRCTCTATTSVALSTPADGVRVLGGVCWITGCTLGGADGRFTGSLPFTPATVALQVQGGTACVASSMLYGGNGMSVGIFGGITGAPAMLVQGGTATIADCTLQGGASPASLPGPAALDVVAATASLARSSLVGGGGSTTGPPSTGAVAQVPELVGMAMPQPFRFGLVTQLVATAGTSQPLAMFGAFDPTPATHPIVLGPFVGAGTPLIPLLAALPQPGAQVVYAVSVPNQPVLLGAAVYAQAFQLDGAFVRASAAVGGVVH